MPSSGDSILNCHHRDVLERLSGSPIKRPMSSTKTTPLHEFDFFRAVFSDSYHHPCQCRSFFRFRQSCFAAPVTHQDLGGHRCSDGAPSAVCGPENLRFQAVSKWWSQVSWLLASPKVAHGVGSTDVGNSIILLGGAARQSGLIGTWGQACYCWINACRGDVDNAVGTSLLLSISGEVRCHNDK